MPTFFARHADTFATIATVILAFVGLVALVDQRFNAQAELINQRFDAQDRYIDPGFVAANQRLGQLTVETSELRNLPTSIIERVSRNEGEIDVIRERFRVDVRAP